MSIPDQQKSPAGTSGHLVDFDPGRHAEAREKIEKAGRYERAKRHVYLALILAAVGLVSLIFSLLRRLFG